ncbi:MAG: FRG domain-containing protein [Pyrinomonadaceae bacterium]|nr:FRG domain-containing protein [Pyrinomonadaceae bacterium]
MAELQFRNREHVLLFRGQAQDHRDRGGNGITTLRPSIFRGNQHSPSTVPGEVEITRRFKALDRAERELVDRYMNEPQFVSDHEETNRLKRQRILRWSILQHYEVCPTPLLDVTQSLRIAASFPSHRSNETVFLFVLGVPNLSGAITASAEAGLQIVRLSSVCPPSAVRPHLQEGYLLGEYPEIDRYEQKAHYRVKEIDFGRRLVAKFRFDPKSFWKGDTFPRITRNAFYPTMSRDPLCVITDGVRRAIE